MNDLTKTVIAVVLASGLAASAYLTRPAPLTDAKFSDQGEVFFPSFTDPLAARSLQVLTYDENKASIRPFKVEQIDAKWVIPSHHNYPADAQKNLAEAASLFVGLTKEQVVTDYAADHESLGVLSPDDNTAPLKGRGTRITINGENGAPLADLIVGKEVKGLPPGETSVQRRYVRLPAKNRVYAVDFKKTFSSNFGDWVETDLLKMQGQPVNTLVVDRYEVDEAAGVKKSIEKVTLTRTSASADPFNPAPTPWQMTAQPGGGPGPGEAVNAPRVEEAIASLRDLKIMGVRPKPPKLAEWFAGRSQSVTQMDVLDLQSRGFFVTQQGQFVANQGEVSASCADGVVYTLYFGELLFGEGDELSAGKDALASDAPTVDGPDNKGQEARYAFVNVTFDENLIPVPTPPAPPAPAETPSDGAPANEPAAEPLPAPGGAEPDPAIAAEQSQPAQAAAEPTPEQRAYEQALADRAKKIEEGKKRRDALSNRFAEWYYVIDAASFAKLRPSRGELVTAAPQPQPTPGMMPQGMPAGMTPPR